jgi:hypothetical protein
VLGNTYGGEVYKDFLAGTCASKAKTVKIVQEPFELFVENSNKGKHLFVIVEHEGQNHIQLFHEEGLEKAPTVQDLKNTDHIGFIDETGTKGYVIAVNSKFYLIDNTHGFGAPNKSYGNHDTEEIIDALINQNSSVAISEVYRFDTRKELYQWLTK